MKAKEFEFLGVKLRTFEHEGEPWVVLKDLVEGMMVRWKGFHEKCLTQDLIEDLRLDQTTVTLGPASPNQGTQGRKVWCIPRESIYAFCMMVPINGNCSEKRAQVVRNYRKHCVRALSDYWEHGLAYNTAVNGIVSKWDTKQADAKSFLSFADRSSEHNFTAMASTLGTLSTPMWSMVSLVAVAYGMNPPTKTESELTRIFKSMRHASLPTLLKELLS